MSRRYERQSEPPLLRGAWQRESIENTDGSSDRSSLVFWLQFETEMVAIRVPTGVADLADRGGLEHCSLAELHRLATSEASTGRTTCTEIDTDGDGVRRATAEWITRQPGNSAYLPVTAYPEPGLLEWNPSCR